MSTFLCGAARRIITPPVGTLLYGYEPDIVSTSVHDDLTATAVAFGDADDPSRTAILISLTLGDLQTALCDEMRAEAARVCGLCPDSVIVASTHTHSGPNVSGLEGWGEIDRGYVDGILLPAVRASAGEAFASMAPAELGIGEGESLVGVNRRVLFPNGLIDFGQDPAGPFDPTMTILALRETGTGRGIVNLIHYGCHGTACGRGHEITRDWSGLMIDALEARTGVLTVFFVGALGDVGPRISNGKTTGDITYVEELGRAAASDALRIYDTIGGYVSPPVVLHKGVVSLPRRPLPPLGEVREALASFKDPGHLTNLPALRYRHLLDAERARLAGEPETAPAFTFPQTLVRLGDVLFVPFPFEPFSEIVLSLRAATGLRPTLALSCANGYFGYLPTERELPRGGYEVGVFRYVELYGLCDDTDRRIVEENVRILRE